MPRLISPPVPPAAAVAAAGAVAGAIQFPEAIITLPRLRHLGTEELCLGGSSSRPLLPSLFPSLTSLSIGRCGRLEALSRPATDAEGADAGGGSATLEPSADVATAAAVHQPAAAAAAVHQPAAAYVAAVGAAAAGGAAGAPPPGVGGGALSLRDLNGCQQLQVLELAGASASQLLRAPAVAGAQAGGCFPSSLRELRLWRVASFEELYQAASLGQRINDGGGLLTTVGLHHCGPAPGWKAVETDARAHGPADVMRSLAYAKRLIIQVRQGGGSHWVG